MAEKRAKINIKITILTKALSALVLFSLVGINFVVFGAAKMESARAGQTFFRSILPVASVAAGPEFHSIGLQVTGQNSEARAGVILTDLPKNWPDLQVVELNYRYVQLLVVSSPGDGGFIAVKIDRYFEHSADFAPQPSRTEAGNLPAAHELGFFSRPILTPAKFNSQKAFNFLNSGTAFLNQPKVTVLLC
jgi:hypothetical protein